MSEIHTRRVYEHISGKLYIVMMIAKPIKEGEPEQVILSSLEDTSIWITPVKTFYDKHPTSGIPRFQLITPVKK